MPSAACTLPRGAAGALGALSGAARCPDRFPAERLPRPAEPRTTSAATSSAASSHKAWRWAERRSARATPTLYRTAKHVAEISARILGCLLHILDRRPSGSLVRAGPSTLDDDCDGFSPTDAQRGKAP